MFDLAASLLHRLLDLIAPYGRQPDLIAIPIRRDDRRGPRR
ncbi:hypothetical protein [Rubellimicrobium arenae]|nr:hypothetical protein [Rubellimicrobium arenae]